MSELVFIKRVVFHEYPGRILILLISEILGSFLVLIGLGAIVSLLASLVDGNSELPGPLGELFKYLDLSQTDSFRILMFLFVLVLVRVLLDGLRQYLAGSIGVHLNKTIKKKMNDALLGADWMRFSGIDQGKYMQCMVAESSLARGAVNDLGAMLAGGLMTVVLLAWMIVFSFETFIIFAISGGFFLITVQALMKRSRRASEHRIKITKEMNNVVNDTRHLFKLLIAEDLVPKRIRITDELINKVAVVERLQLLYSILVENYVTVISAVVMVLVSYFYLVLGLGAGGNLIFNLLLLQRIGVYFGTFQSKRRNMIQKIPSYEACLDMMEVFHPPASGNPHLPGSVLLERSVSLEGVSYIYAEGYAGVRNISLKLPPKGLVFLLGRSGSGKTTLADILMGLIRPSSGRILIDGHDLAEIDREQWSRMIAYVPQQAYLFKGTLRENLTFGSENVDDATIFLGLEQADCGDVVRVLPCGLDTLVLPGGTNFSGGERHRFSLARGIIRQAKVLVLDEPSSALDVRSELSILDSLKMLSRDMLIVVITHSPDLIKGMENLFLFDQGEFVWEGNYAQLLEREDSLDDLERTRNALPLN